jgi:hypothetical protein
MEFKGTKGEWKITDSSYITPLSENFAIAKVFTGDESICTSKNERLANLKLIAAAPELLKVCIELQEVLHNISMPSKVMSDLEVAINKALN